MRKSHTAEVIEKFKNKREIAERESDRRKFMIHAEIPEIGEIDRELHATSLTILGIASSGADIDGKMQDLRTRNAELREKRAKLLADAGYPEDYTDVVFECEKCSDTGYTESGDICECMRKELAAAALEDSGIGSLAKTQGFDTFNFNYYSGDDLNHAAANYRALKHFAEEFDPALPANFLLIGHTGLGKTHLSTAVAKVVIEKGYKVIYDTIDGIISDFEAEKFKETVTHDEIGERYYESDLLIIDDLGCEMSTKFTVACVYNLINTRINRNKSTIINTNLTYDELLGAYDDRITSRIFGEFRTLLFTGRDIRQQKLGGK
ncbi:MAG: ATP-binding protein [Clostridia bacterium]|nr:ATP-binding protein [Clostridia bacterium]